MATITSTTSARLRSSSTLSALHYPNFRLYFFGQIVSLSGSWMQIVAQGWLVYHLTQSELWLGIVACAAGVPSLLLSPFAGVLVDRFSRRSILLYSQTAQMALAFTLAALTFSNTIQVYHIVLLAFLLGVTNAIDAPSRQAIIVDLVGHEDLKSGIALNAIMFNGSRVIGPAFAGVLLIQFGPAWCFFINGVSFLAVIFTLWLMHLPVQIKPPGGLSPIKQLQEGVRFARQHETIAPLLLMAATASIFTINISTLLPAFADTALKSPADGFAALSTAIGIGATVAGISMTYLGKRFGRGRVVMTMTLIVSIFSLLVTRMDSILPAAVLIGFYGFGIIMQFATVNTMLQSEVPDMYRGRIMSLYTLTWFGLSPFGALTLGALAGLTGTPNAMAIYILIGGTLNAFILARSPKIRALR